SGGHVVFRFVPQPGKPTAFPGLRCGGSGRISIRCWISRSVFDGVRDYRGHTRSRAGFVETAQRRWETGIRRTARTRISPDGIANPRCVPGGNITLGQSALDHFPDLFSRADWIRPSPSDMLIYKRPAKSAPTAMTITYSIVEEPLRLQPRLRCRGFFPNSLFFTGFTSIYRHKDDVGANIWTEAK